jgi:hypothetical protein
MIIKFELNGKKFKSIEAINQTQIPCMGCHFFNGDEVGNKDCQQTPHNCLVENVIYVEDKE